MDKRKGQDDAYSGAILGKRLPVSQFTPIGALAPGLGTVVISGKVFLVERWVSLCGSVLLRFGVADADASVRCEVSFADRDAAMAVSHALEVYEYVAVAGEIETEHDGALWVKARHIWPAPRKERQDTAAEKRVELHAHTCYSAMDALIQPQELVRRAASWGMPAVAVTDHGGVQAFPELWRAGKEYGVKVIYGVEGYYVDDVDGSMEGKPLWHICLLAKNSQGLKNLYRIVSASHIQYYDKENHRPIMPKSLIQAHREGLLIGSACAQGELYQAVLQGRAQEALERAASFYDYFEIMPIGNRRCLVENGMVRDDEALREIDQRIVLLGKHLGKPVVATCDAHFLDPDEEAARRVLLASGEASSTERDLPLYFRTTEEVLAQFAYLGEKTCREVVIDGPRRIADQVEEVDPLPERPCLPTMENATEELESLVVEELRRVYGETPPACVTQRVEAELDGISRQGHAAIYLTAQKLTRRSLECGGPVGVRGGVGASLVAYLSGITEIDPLPPHYVCPHCKRAEFFADGSYACGADLPDKLCPVCGGAYRKTGFDIPMETFFGAPGEEKLPDIDLLLAAGRRDEAAARLRELFGEDRVLRAGTIRNVIHKSALEMVEAYLAQRQISATKMEKERLAASLVGVKRATGCWLGGYVILPRGVEVTDLCPVQWAGEDPDSGALAIHFDVHAIRDSFWKLDLSEHSAISMLGTLQALTGVDPRTIPLDDGDTMGLFTSSEALGYTGDPLLGPTGACALPEFGTSFARGLLADTQPKTFSGLARLCGFANGTGAWRDNAQRLVLDEGVSLSDTVSCRDDIMLYLVRQGVPPETAYAVMEAVRKGRVNRDGFQDGWVEAMQAHGVPDWYIESLAKISYLCHKAYAVSCAELAFRAAWFKLHHPLAFYVAFFAHRAKELDPAMLCQGMASVKDRLERAKSKRRVGLPSRAAEDAYMTLDALYEFYLRGYGFIPAELPDGHALRFEVADSTHLKITPVPTI